VAAGCATCLFTGALALVFGAGCSTALPAGTEPDLPVVNVDLAADNDLASCHNDCPAEGMSMCTTDGKRQLCMKDGACLVWGPAADCDAGNLCCNGQCVPSDAENCFACGTVCSGATPVCSPTLMGCTCTALSCATTHQDCDANQGACVSCVAPPVPETRSDFYVDSRAQVAATGSLGCPFSTVGGALSPAGASQATTRTVHVAAGIYANEVFPLVVRNGVSVVGESAATTILQGEGKLDHSAAGGALNGTGYYATVLAGDASQVNALSNLTLRPAASPSPVPSHFGVFCDQGNTPQTIANPPSPSPSPNTLLSNLTLTGYDYGLIVTNSTVPSATGCDVRMVSSTLTSNNVGAWVVGCGTGGPGSIVAATVGDLGSATGNNFKSNSNAGHGGYGLIVWDCSSPVGISNNTFDGDDSGIALAQHGRLDPGILVPGYITVENNVFKNLYNFGLDMGAAVLVERLIGNSFTNITNAGSTGTGIILENSSGGAGNYRPQIKRARNNQIIGNDVGMIVRGGTPIAPDPSGFDTDFGTDADPGNNLFRCNSSTGAIGYDLQVASMATGGGTLRFAGNQWDHAPPSAASGSGANGTDVIITAPSNPPTMLLDNPAVSTATCPAGRSP
jgi:Protein of unknown function (DUF1565)